MLIISIPFQPLGSGEHLFAGIDLPRLGFTETQTVYGACDLKEKQVSLR